MLRSKIVLRLLILLIVSISICLFPPKANAWNYKAIKWYGYKAGLNAAKKHNKPVLIVFDAKWCKVCRRYRKLFYNKQVVKQTKRLIMIKVDIEQNRQLQKRYSIDGGYIPRTMVLAADGSVHRDITGGHEKFKYFLNVTNPSELLSVMQRAADWY